MTRWARLAAILAAGAFAAVAPCGAQGADFSVLRLVFLPPTFGPGEEVEAVALLAPLRTPPAAGLTARPGSGLPEAGDAADPELRELRLARVSAGWELRLRFVAWSPGQGSLPSLVAGGRRLPALPYAAAPRLGPADRDPSPPRAQRVPPGTGLYLYGLAGLAIFIVFGAALTAAWLIPAARALLARWKAAQAFRRLGRTLDFLAASPPGSSAAGLYAALARALRLFLAERVEPLSPALTAAELRFLPEESFPAPGLRDRAAGLLARSESVRYGEATALPGEIAADIQGARSLATDVEEALLAGL